MSFKLTQDKLELLPEDTLQLSLMAVILKLLCWIGLQAKQ